MQPNAQDCRKERTQMRRYKVTIEGAPSGKALFQDTKTGELYYLGMRIDAREISEGYGFYERPFLSTHNEGQVIKMNKRRKTARKDETK